MTNINLKTILMLLLSNASQILATEPSNEQLYQELQEIKTTMKKMGQTLNAVALKLNLEEKTYEPESEERKNRLIDKEEKRTEEVGIQNDGFKKALNSLGNVSENIKIPNMNTLFQFGNSNLAEES